MIDQYLLNHIDAIKKLCEHNKVDKLFAFGSVVDGRFEKGKSDIDLLVIFDNEALTKRERAKALLSMWIQLQSLLNCKVDIITDTNIKGAYFKKYLELYKEMIYDKDEVTL